MSVHVFLMHLCACLLCRCSVVKMICLVLEPNGNFCGVIMPVFIITTSMCKFQLFSHNCQYLSVFLLVTAIPDGRYVLVLHIVFALSLSLTRLTVNKHLFICLLFILLSFVKCLSFLYIC